MNPTSINIEARRIDAEEAPAWSGDLKDDCTSLWAGFRMRAEEMDEGVWWYSVIDVSSGLVVEDSSIIGHVQDGSGARQKCEEAARRFLGLNPAR